MKKNTKPKVTKSRWNICILYHRELSTKFITLPYMASTSDPGIMAKKSERWSKCYSYFTPQIKSENYSILLQMWVHHIQDSGQMETEDWHVSVSTEKRPDQSIISTTELTNHENTENYFIKKITATFHFTGQQIARCVDKQVAGC